MFVSKMQKLILNFFSFIMLSHVAVQNDDKYYIEDIGYTEGMYTYTIFFFNDCLVVLLSTTGCC